MAFEALAWPAGVCIDALCGGGNVRVAAAALARCVVLAFRIGQPI